MKKEKDQIKKSGFSGLHFIKDEKFEEESRQNSRESNVMRKEKTINEPREKSIGGKIKTK